MEPHRYWMPVTTHDDFRHHGFDNTMIRWRLSTVEQGEPQQLWTCYREDFVPVVEFLEPFGFAEVFRRRGSHFDVQSFDFERFRPLVKELEIKGIRFSAFADLEDAKHESKLLSLYRRLEENASIASPSSPRTLRISA